MLIHHIMLVINSQFCWFSSLPPFKRDYVFLISNNIINGKREKNYYIMTAGKAQILKK